MDFGEELLRDYLLDQEVGLVTLQDAPELPIHHKAPYKQMPNYGTSTIGPSRPLLTVSGADMECDKIWPSRGNSPSPRILARLLTVQRILSTRRTAPCRLG